MKILLMLAGVIFALSSCSEQKTPPFLGEPSVLTFNGGLVFTKANNPASSKASSEELIDGTDIGIYVITTTADGTQIPLTTFENTPWSNLHFTPGTNNSLINNSGKEIIVRTGASRYGIYAYSPRIDTNPTDAKSIPVVHDKDILWVKIEGLEATKSETPIDLVFEHRGSQIKFKMVDKSPGKTLDFSEATLSLSGFTQNGTLDLQTGLLSLLDRDQTLTWAKVGLITDSDMTNTNILVDGKTVTITAKVSGVKEGTTSLDPFSGTLTYALEPGYAYLYNVNVGVPSDVNNVIVLECDIKDWVDTISADVPAT